MVSRKAMWGWGVSFAVALVCIADVGVMLFAPGVLAEPMRATGFPQTQLPLLAGILGLSTVLFLLPRTALWGAILLTGFFGGAVCTHVRIGEIGSPPEMICVAIGLAAWVGLALRDPVVGGRLLGAAPGAPASA
ncbi:membrane protein [Camelimonas fluminis]|uniref:DoxX family protein n=1 Tax=Camelimonas fluminis TaxID=1576911 RepID=A0ABV7UJD8_9HYPH|nr:DoxX family protein [Camelimonas fluminis]GHE60232.1 membrane protein [Camelimonas fluminis]